MSVGTELLLGQIVDSNAAILGELFAELGIRHVRRQTVGDNVERLVEALRLALSRAEIVITIGGLGPTQDDITRDGIAAVLDSPLIVDPAEEANLRDLFETMKRAWVPSQIRQAMRPECAAFIPNPFGTAPGLDCRKDGKVILAMPGPRNEFLPMARGVVHETLMGLGFQGVIHSRTLRVAGIGEAAAEQLLGDLIRTENPTIAPYAKTAEVHFRVTARAATKAEAEALIVPYLEQVRKVLGPCVYGEDDESLESVVLRLMRQRGMKLAVAESCTGGGLGARVTSVSGASDVFLGGVISYDNAVKTQLLRVPEALLQEHGAVSEQCAAAMADGVCKLLGADVGVSITGVAGPLGGTPEKPVGMVFVGISGSRGTSVHELKLRGSREDIRVRASQAALYDLYRHLS